MPKCALCDEDHPTEQELFLHSICHPKSQLEVTINQETSIMRVYCGICHKGIVEFQAGNFRNIGNEVSPKGDQKIETTH